MSTLSYIIAAVSFPFFWIGLYFYRMSWGKEIGIHIPWMCIDTIFCTICSFMLSTLIFMIAILAGA